MILLHISAFKRPSTNNR